MSADVLEEAPLGLNVSNDVEDSGPEVAGVSGPEALTGVAEGLTGIAANDSIHLAAPRCAVEGS